jgi:hypothetical protein
VIVKDYRWPLAVIRWPLVVGRYPLATSLWPLKTQIRSCADVQGLKCSRGEIFFSPTFSVFYGMKLDGINQ